MVLCELHFEFNLVEYVPCLQLSVLHSHSIKNKVEYFLCIRYWKNKEVK